ncbi:MAG: hypothetical protein V4467_03580 [Patescibacteria group bacterium]
MSDSSKKDFLKFAFGFMGMISVSFLLLVGVGFYQVEISDANKLSSVETAK